MYQKINEDIRNFLISKTHLGILSVILIHLIYYRELFSSLIVLSMFYLTLSIFYIVYISRLGKFIDKFLKVYIDFFRFLTPDYIYMNWLNSENPNGKPIITSEIYKNYQKNSLIRNQTNPEDIPEQSGLLFILFLIIFVSMMVLFTYLSLSLTSIIFGSFLSFLYSLFIGFIISMTWMHITSPIWEYINNIIVKD